MSQLNTFRRLLLALLSMFALGTVASVSIGNSAESHGDITPASTQVESATLTN